MEAQDQGAPNRPWIFSVRLDEIAVPKYEISANQDLTDLNWTDFFGPKKTVAATQHVGRVQELLGGGQADGGKPVRCGSERE